MTEPKKRGGKRPNSSKKVDPVRGRSKSRTTTLYDDEWIACRNRFGTIAAAVRWAIANAPHAKYK